MGTTSKFKGAVVSTTFYDDEKEKQVQARFHVPRVNVLEKLYLSVPSLIWNEATKTFDGIDYSNGDVALIGRAFVVNFEEEIKSFIKDLYMESNEVPFEQFWPAFLEGGNDAYWSLRNALIAKAHSCQFRVVTTS